MNDLINNEPKLFRITDLIGLFKNNFSFLYLVFTLISIIVEAHYYKKFGINIFSYLELTEYFIQFFKYFYELITSIFLTCLICYIVFTIIFIFRFATKSYSTPIKRLNLIGFVSTILISILILYLLDTEIYSLVGIGLGLYIWYLYHSYINTYRKSKGFHEHDLPYIFFLFVVIIIFVSTFNHESNIEKPKKSIIFLNTKEVIKTGYGITIVGETNNYIFLRNVKSNKTRVINRDKVEEINFY